MIKHSPRHLLEQVRIVISGPEGRPQSFTFEASMDDERWPLGASVLFVLATSLALWALIGAAVWLLIS